MFVENIRYSEYISESLIIDINVKNSEGDFCETRLQEFYKILWYNFFIRIPLEIEIREHDLLQSRNVFNGWKRRRMGKYIKWKKRKKNVNNVFKYKNVTIISF